MWDVSFQFIIFWMMNFWCEYKITLFSKKFVPSYTIGPNMSLPIQSMQKCPYIGWNPQIKHTYPISPK
uniref:Putative ovule protein n=1 Tax=Solanum chacoense TaxID=4108 RepID=A0A0V0H4B0_SOLCH